MSIQLPSMLGSEHYFEQFGGGIREGLSPDKGPIAGGGPKGHWGLPGHLCISICRVTLFHCNRCGGCVQSHLVQSQVVCRTIARLCAAWQHPMMQCMHAMSDTVLMYTQERSILRGKEMEWRHSIGCWLGLQSCAIYCLQLCNPQL